MTHKEKAMKIFYENFNCSQANAKNFKEIQQNMPCNMPCYMPKKSYFAGNVT